MPIKSIQIYLEKKLHLLQTLFCHSQKKDRMKVIFSQYLKAKSRVKKNHKISSRVVRQDPILVKVQVGIKEYQQETFLFLAKTSRALHHPLVRITYLLPRSTLAYSQNQNDVLE